MKPRTVIQAFALATVLFIPVARAQEQQPAGGSASQSSGQQGPVQPVPPDQGDSSGHAMPAPAGRLLTPEYESQTQQSPQAQPDTHALSGGETFGLGSLSGLPRIFDPALHLSESGDIGTIAGKNESVTSFGGSLTLNQGWGHYLLIAQYRGAKTIYYPESAYNQTYHDLNLSQAILGGRWTLRVRDDLLYSPQAGFGGLYNGGPGFYGAAGVQGNILPSLAPGETILTGQARRLNNAVLGEVDYALSRRSTVTFTGAYGLLHFMDPGYIDSQHVNGRLGYDYALSPRDTISLIYGYERTSFTGNGRNIDANMAQLAFGRKVTGRLAFQIAGGPQFLRFHNFESSNTRSISWDVHSALTYAMRLTTYSFSYSHGMTGGSGVFYGAETDRITAAMNHQFTRFWSGTLNGGYARNSNFVATSSTSEHFNNWFAGGNVSHQMGRHLQFILSYAFQQQNLNGTVCQVASCGSTRLRQMFGITVQWHPVTIRERY
jgi:hypothetical protein